MDLSPMRCKRLQFWYVDESGEFDTLDQTLRGDREVIPDCTTSAA
jgi:hypothetical protein